MIVDSDVDRSTQIKHLLLEKAFDVVTLIDHDINLHDQCRKITPDIVIIVTESPSCETLNKLCVMSQYDPRPVLIFTHDANKEKIKAATQAGASAYVVGSISNERLIPVIDAAVARFEEVKHLRHELKLANLKLNERKVVERAKGLLMKQRNLDEEEAYVLLRNMAMKRNIKLVDLAKQLLEAAKMLII